MEAGERRKEVEWCGKTRCRGRKKKREPLIESPLYKWCHQVAWWWVDWDRRTQSCLFPACWQTDRRTREQVPHSNVWPAGPGPGAMLKGTTRAGFSFLRHSHTFLTPPPSLDKPYSHDAHVKLVIYSGWHQNACASKKSENHHIHVFPAAKCRRPQWLSWIWSYMV